MTREVNQCAGAVPAARYAVHADPEIPARLVSRLLADPAFPLSEASTRIVKDGDTTLVVRVEWPIGGRLVPVAYKCVRRLTWLKRLTQAVGTNRTWRTWRAGKRLEELGIPTAKPLLIVLPGRWDWRLPSWIANEWLDDARDVGQLTREHARGESEARVDELARVLGDVLGRLHRAGGSHRDLKPENVMGRLASDETPAGVWLIDLDGLRFRWRVSARRRWRELSRLAVGIDEAGGARGTNRLRFLHAYRKAFGDKGDWKSDWRALQRATQRRAAKRARKY